MINGRIYRFNENHRWERVREEEVTELLPKEITEKTGAKSYEEFSELCSNVTKIWNLDREAIEYLNGDFVNKVKDELKELGRRDDISEDLLIKTATLGVLIKEYFRKVQTNSYNDSSEMIQEAETIKNLLAEFVNKYGNPHEIKALQKLIGKTHLDPALMLLQAIDKEGKYHKIFDSPSSFFNVYYQQSEVGSYDEKDLYSVVRYLHYNGIEANPDKIALYYRGSEDIELALLRDKEIFLNEKGNYAPANEVCVGTVSDKLEAWKKQIQAIDKEIQETDDEDKRAILNLKRKKLEGQIIEIS